MPASRFSTRPGGSPPPTPTKDSPTPSRDLSSPRADPRRGSPVGAPGADARIGTMNSTQLEKIKAGGGFFAALDQSGGSTPKALAEYGIEPDRYSNDTEMFDFVHAMRTRVFTSPAF